MSTRQTVVHGQECACYLQGLQFGNPYRLVVVPPCREIDNTDHSDGRNIPTSAQIADAAAIIKQARTARRQPPQSGLDWPKHIINLETRVKDLEARLESWTVENLHDRRCPKCWWPMHSASVPCR